MAGDVKRTIQMLLDAEDLGTQKIEDLIGSIEKLEKAQRDYAKSGKVSAQTIDELRERVVALKDASRQLTARGALIDAFNAQNEVVTKATERLRLNEKALADYKIELGSVGAVSDQQAQKMARLEKAVAGASEKLTKASAAAATTRERLGKLGITDLTKAQQQLANYAERTGAALRETESDLKTYSRRVRETKEAEAALRAEVERRVTADQQAAARAVESQRRIAAAFNIRTKAEIASLRVQRQADLEAAFDPKIARQAELEAAALARQNAIRDRLIRVINRTGVEIGKETLAQKRNTDATNVNTAAKNRSTTATNRAGNAQSAFAAKGKTALTVYQRVRGQVLALASAYIGVYQAIQLAQRALDVTVQREAAEVRLGVANQNDQRKTGEDLQFVREQADRLGLSFTELANSYSKFRITGDAANLSLEKQRKIFLSFSEAATVLRLSTEDTQGVFRALEQSFSKGTVQMEELRGQLGDRLPGAFTKFAKALGKSTEELDKLIEDGRVSAQSLEFLGDILAEEVAGKLPNAVSSFQANVNRLKTAFDDFVKRIADGGFRSEIESLSQDLAAFFNSDDGQAFAYRISNAFSFLIKVTKALIENFDTFLVVVKAIVAIRFAGVLAGWYSSILQNAAGLVRLTKALGAAAAGTRSLGFAVKSAFGPIGLLLAIATEAVIYFGLQTDESAEATERLAEQVLRLRTAQGDQLETQIRLNESRREELEFQKLQIEKLREEAKERLAVAKSKLAELAANPALLAGAGTTRDVGESPIVRRQREAIENARREVNDLETKLAENRNEAATLDSELDAARTRRAAEQQAALLDVQKEFIALQAELGDKANQEKLKKDDEYYNEVYRRFREFNKKFNGISRDFIDGTLQRDVDRFRESTRPLFADAAGFILPGGKDGEKGAESRAKKLEAAERRLQDALRGIREDALKAEEQSLRAQLDLIDSEIDKKIADVKRVQEELRRLDPAKAAAQQGNVDGAVAQLNTLRDQNKAKAQALYIQKQIEQSEKSTREEIEKRRGVVDRLNGELQAGLQLIQSQLELGLITENDAAQQAFDLQKEKQDELLAKIDEYLAYLNGITDVDLAEKLGIKQAITEAETLRQRIANIPTEAEKYAKQFKEQFADGMADSLINVGTNIADVIRGFQSWGDAIKNIKDTFLNFVADFLINIAKMIAQQAILNALQQGKSSGGFFGFVAGLIAPTKHTGGIVGASGPTRTVSPLAFAAAARYHSGGIAGLAPDEVPTILRKGEEVLTESDPRHRNNGGMGAAGKTEVKVVNTIDPGSFVSEGLNTKPGQQAFMNFIRANKAAVRSAIS